MDIFPKVPYHTLSEEDQVKYWDDGLHMSRAGYDLLGNHVADALLKLIAKDELPVAINPPPIPPLIKPTLTETIFEEEEGTPKHISRGYVIVRKKDLD